MPEMDAQGRMVVGIPDVYTEVRHIAESVSSLATEVARINGHLTGIDTRNRLADNSHSSLISRIDAAESRLDRAALEDTRLDVEKRIRHLERYRLAIPASLITALASAAVAAVAGLHG